LEQKRQAYLIINEVGFNEFLELNVIKTTRITGKNFDFTGNRTKKGAEGRLSVFNLNYEFEDKDLSVEIWAGYDEPFLLFKGDVIGAEPGRSGADKKIDIMLSDGIKLHEAEKEESYGSGVTEKTILMGMLDDLKKAGAEIVDNILEKVNNLLGEKKTTKSKARKKIMEGINKVLSGAEKEAEPIIHNGIIDFLVEGEIGGTIIDLNYNSGLVGTINQGWKKEKGKTIKTKSCTSLLHTDYRIGQKINLNGEVVTIDEVGYNMSNYRSPYYAELKVI
jgi:adenosyl cobinamide kinase/adenosyl cobinamide phosphate guanylyltransferase